MQSNGPRMIHYTELPRFTDGGPLTVERDFYIREVGRLLAEGHEGRWVLIKGEEIIGIYDTQDEAMDEGRKRYFLLRQPYMVHRIQTWERPLRISWMWMAGSCRTSL
jgi:hypothetical protein